MGKRGPIPKDPSQVHTPGGKHKRARRPQSRQDVEPVSEPGMPPGMSEYARREWRKLVPLLVARKVLCILDQRSLEQYCRALSRLHDLDVMYDKMMRASDKYSYDDLAKVRRDVERAGKVVIEHGRRFGLSPADRSRILTGDQSSGAGKEAKPKARPALSIMKGKTGKDSA